MDIVAKAATYFGFALALGASVFSRFVFPDPPAAARRALAWGPAVGALLVVVGAVMDVAAVLVRVARVPVDADLVRSYVSVTLHGRASLLRVGLAVVAGMWGGIRIRTAAANGRTSRAHRSCVFVERGAFVAFGLAWLATAAWVGHSGAMGLGGAIASLAHLTAVVAWAGALAWLAWLPVWPDGARLGAAVDYVGRVGVVSVIVLAASGTAMARLHLHPLAAIVSSSYGWALLAKLALVAAVVATAAVNRWRRVPAFARGERGGLWRAVRLESALLAAVIVATSVLATRPPMHGG